MREHTLQEKIQFAERAWLAYWALPLDRFGQPPAYKHLEKEYSLPEKHLSRVFSGKIYQGTPESYAGLMLALHTDDRWLRFGLGRIPKTPPHMPPCPARAFLSGARRYEIPPREGKKKAR